MIISPAVSILKNSSQSSISHFVPGFWVFSRQMLRHPSSIGFLIVTYLIHLKRWPRFLACWCLHNWYCLQAYLAPQELRVETAQWTGCTWRWIAFIIKQTMVLVSNIRSPQRPASKGFTAKFFPVFSQSPPSMQQLIHFFNRRKFISVIVGGDYYSPRSQCSLFDIFVNCQCCWYWWESSQVEWLSEAPERPVNAHVWACEVTEENKPVKT